MLVGQVLRSQVAGFPAKWALRITEQNVRWTFGQLQAHSAAVGAGLLDLGLQPGRSGAPGDAVAVALDCSAEQVAVFLGAAQAGLKVAAFDSPEAISKEALASALKMLNCKALVASPKTLPVVHQTLPQLSKYHEHESPVLDLDDYPYLKYVFHTGTRGVPGAYRFKDLLLYNAEPDRLANVPENNEATFFVSLDAATGKVKEEMTQKQLVEECEKKAKELGLKAESRLLLETKSDYASKMLIGSLACAVHAAQFVVAGGKYDPELIQKAQIEDYCDAKLS